MEGDTNGPRWERHFLKIDLPCRICWGSRVHITLPPLQVVFYASLCFRMSAGKATVLVTRFVRDVREIAQFILCNLSRLCSSGKGRWHTTSSLYTTEDIKKGNRESKIEQSIYTKQKKHQIMKCVYAFSSCDTSCSFRGVVSYAASLRGISYDSLFHGATWLTYIQSSSSRVRPRPSMTQK